MSVDEQKHQELFGAAENGANWSKCANCGAVVSGAFCSDCGQRTDTHTHSVGHFIAEATEVLTHADSRVWNTLLPLLARPGFLTREYFSGRRARYLQPFRLYLILSVVFFLIAGLLAGSSSVSIKEEKVGVDSHLQCANAHINLPAENWLRPRILAACERIVADHGKAFSESVVHNIGRGMFVFLPLIAALMKLLYWRPRRYYLEHLLLLIHNHAFVFLWLSVFSVAIHWVRSSGWISFMTLLMLGYLVRYLFGSMKIMYEQSRAFTVPKFLVLGMAYAFCGLIMLVATTVVSAIAV